MHVAHGDGGDQVAVEERRAGEREPVAADHARFLRLCERRGERRNLVRLLALMAGERAGERVKEHQLAVLAHLLRQSVKP
jgi:hypothetical protein